MGHGALARAHTFITGSSKRSWYSCLLLCTRGADVPESLVHTVEVELSHGQTPLSQPSSPDSCVQALGRVRCVRATMMAVGRATRLSQAQRSGHIMALSGLSFLLLQLRLYEGVDVTGTFRLLDGTDDNATEVLFNDILSTLMVGSWNAALACSQSRDGIVLIVLTQADTISGRARSVCLQQVQSVLPAAWQAHQMPDTQRVKTRASGTKHERCERTHTTHVPRAQSKGQGARIHSIFR